MMGYLRPVGADAAHRALLMSYQCALCHHIGATYGFPYRLFAGPDLVFYNLFLDLVGEGVPGESRRACVLAPKVTALRCRDTTENTRLAAAFGVWMAVAKLEDDLRDEGGGWKWLAWRAFASGGAQARATLREAGFPVDAIEDRFREQAEVEAAGTLPLDEAARPSAEIARLAFGFAGRGDTERTRLAGEVGAGIGRYLFFMDNLLDYGRDVAEGGYNALARAFCAAPTMPEEARAAGVAGARGEIAGLRATLSEIPVSGERAWLTRVLVHGFSDKVRRWEALPVARHATSSLRDITPRLSWREAFTRLSTRAWTVATVRARVAMAFLVAWFFPKRAWAEDWWPADTGDLGLDTGVADPVAAAADTAGRVESGDGESTLIVCDALAGNCGWCDVEGCFDACCGEACDEACSDVNCCQGAQ